MKADFDRFIEVDFIQKSKHRENAFGDVFMSQRLPDEDRLVCVLADGLGSGIKANVLATLTATMAMKYITSDIDIVRASEIIMATLPVCSKRKIGYSTFTIVDVESSGQVRVIEYENPSFVLAGNDGERMINRTFRKIKTDTTGEREILYSSFTARQNDRLVVFSDGVSQSGIGTEELPLGWGGASVERFIQEQCDKNDLLSARSLARQVVNRALENDKRKPKDDITCGVINFRRPRKMLVVTGPPYSERNDSLMAHKVKAFDGKKVICGGTTASIIARELETTIEFDLLDRGFDVPPASKMSGFELVTEGTLTLTKVMDLLETGVDVDEVVPDAATELVKLFLDSDIIQFMVGTKINAAHQDPNLPAELDIRRNLIKKIVRLLNEKYLKEAEFGLI